MAPALVPQPAGRGLPVCPLLLRQSLDPSRHCNPLGRLGGQGRGRPGLSLESEEWPISWPLTQGGLGSILTAVGSSQWKLVCIGIGGYVWGSGQITLWVGGIGTNVCVPGRSQSPC